MTREEAKELLPIIQAFAEGKSIQVKTKDRPWFDLLDNNLEMCGIFEYRIKPEPEPKYRPFKTQEECWNEMLKHQPFGWVNDLTEKNTFHNIIKIHNEYGNVYIETELSARTLSESFERYAFIDGTPFGIKEGKQWNR